MERDAKTSPAWLQPLQFLLLLAIALYFVAAFQLSFSRAPAWAVPGLWQMFSLRDRGAAYVAAHARFEGSDKWEPVDLAALFPTRWGSGYRFSRSSFKKSKSRMGVLGASACLRMEVKPIEIRFTEIRWGKILGGLDRVDEHTRDLHRHRCGTRVRLPGGRILPDDATSP